MESKIIRTELMPGTALCGGKYVIEKKIGAGGFGITYIAKHSILEKRYAIKEFFLSGYNVRNSENNHVSLQGIEENAFDKFRLSFINEARVLGSLNNDAIVKVIDIFNENGTSYMVMPFVTGFTLQKMVEKDGPMEYEMAVNYVVRICGALSYIHSKNILHRDVTPDNIIVTPEQKTVLIDFGSARRFINDKTQRHTTILKQGYAPLEQYSVVSKKGAYTDLYSLGGVFYYILTGVCPMDATERITKKMKEPRELNSKIPEQINAVIMKAMEMDSANRYQSASDFENDILSGNFPIKQKINKDTNIGVKTKKNGNILKYITLAIVIFIVLMAVLTHRNAIRVVGNEEQIQNIESLEKPVLPFDSLITENIDSVMQKLDKTSYKDPVALYELARLALMEKNNDTTERFWVEVLIAQGDVSKYIIDKNNNGEIYDYSPLCFAFVCAARAYSYIDSVEYTSQIKEELSDSLTYMLGMLTQLGVENKFIFNTKDE